MIKTMLLRLSITGLLLALNIMPAVADVPEQQKPEVEHLLSYVRASHCIVHRNDTDHHAEKAVEHMKNKYRYFRDEIQSTEDFISYAATKSTITGRRYTVSCPGQQTIDTERWLLDELDRYRAQQQDRGEIPPSQSE
jgi:hypothetical protein